ncbi:sigma-70 family RNA polymerase sigma factor [Corallococcus praedator]|uniref:Sigma-70 family RNA polymerase sigma factor n=1 Tax=Corallococcus praedator TaxID=2316724 RepID=A0ABX9QFD8_9BACT|nr:MULTISPECIES: RNA polymerase factor sigma-32 [Corallococcus]RKH21064.1 sigma-70 family RNA polymerase sigma factor [Corallococcus sp. CA047B]RKH32931.1 sigma-70 family RNA polymerase sigma factor [Corallococcus sp. CA031C]RKI02666.1 sigma-70 family RNA polymerase sigma factor [Corallococcus praedator]
MQASNSFSSADSLSTYLSEINQYPLLSPQEEQALSRSFRAGDLSAGHHLVTSNLRFVVKVAYEYRSYGLKMSDLIQEANIGLMKAVQKFDPEKGIRLISYAVWWIRAYIQNYVLRNWSLVKLGTTQAQRRLFFSLARTRRELEKLGAGDGHIVNAEEIARKLNVKPTEVREMEQRMGGRDLSLDAPVGEDGDATHLDFVESEAASHADEVADRQQAGLTRTLVQRALTRLDPRERFIIEQRVMSDSEMTLSELGEHFGFSRERARQLEIRAKDKLKAELANLMAEAGLDQAELAA